MERLHFVCPNTGQDIDVGIDSELETLLRIRNNHVLARCPVCGERHEWEVARRKAPPGRISARPLVRTSPRRSRLLPDGGAPLRFLFW